MNTKKNNFNRIVFIYIFIAVLLPVLLMGLVHYGVLNYYTYDQVLNKNEILSKDIANRLDQILDSVTNQIKTIATIQGMDLKGDILLYAIHELYKRYNFFDSIQYYDSNNKLIYSIPDKQSFYNFDYSYAPYISEARHYAEAVWGDIEISEFLQKPSINYTVPAINNGQISGFISAYIHLDKLLNSASMINQLTDSFDIILTDSKSTILSSPERNINTAVMKQLYIEDRFKNTCYINNEHFIVHSKNIETTKWNIYILQPYNSAFSHTIFQRISLISVILLSFIIITITSFIGYRKVFLPIRQMTIFTAKVSRGKYELPKYNFHIKELRILYDNFIRMVNKITERENMLKESEKKYRNLVEESIDALFKISSGLQVTYVSPSIITLLGYSEKEFISIVNNLNGPGTVLPDKKFGIKALKIIKDTFIKEAIQPAFTLKTMKKDGNYAYIEIQTVPLRNENGTVTEIQATARDITRRFLAERKADFFKTYLFNVIDSMPSVIITINKDNRVDQFNSSALKFFDTNSTNLKDSLITTVSETLYEYNSYFDIVRKNKTPLDFNETITKNKKVIHCKVTIFPFKSSEDLLVLRIDDVTNISITERQLRQAQKFKSIGTMAEGLAHDFNNILGALSGTINLLDYKKTNNMVSEIAEDIDILKEISEKGKTIVKQLSSISRPTNIKFLPCELNTTINDILNELANKIEINVPIIFTPFHSTSFIRGNENEIHEMFEIILKNSIELSPNNNEMNIQISLIDDYSQSNNNSNKIAYWQISITETAFYMEKDDIDNIFDPYYQIRTTGKQQGISLSAAYNIAKNHNGFIDCYSDKESGTTYTICLPILKEKDDLQSNIKEIKPKKVYKGTGTILIVDDENIIRYTSKRMLEVCGYKILEAKSGTEAITIFKEHHKKISCILLDFYMPDMNGFQVFKEISKIDKSVKVLLSSGTLNNPAVEQALNGGIKHFLLKPYTFEDLSEKIYQLIEE